MNQEQYQLLCECCDRLLLAADVTMERVANPWLHIVREHPVFLRRYAGLFSQEHGGGSASGIRTLLRETARTIYRLAKSATSEASVWQGRPHGPQVSVLIVSHLINEDHAGADNDFYFGDLADQLIGSGFPAAIALINHTGCSAAELERRWPRKAQRYVLPEFLGFGAEWRILRRLHKERQRLLRLASSQPSMLARKVVERAALEAVSGSSARNLRLEAQVDALIRVLKPRVLLFTHEGHAWERVAMAAARRADPSIRCIGYQHAALFRLQHGLRRPLAPEYNPDVIVTAGSVGLEQLRESEPLAHVPMAVLGSVKSVEREQAQSPRLDQGTGKACLVLPEGVEDECVLLFGLSLVCAMARPDLQFIWRLHPLISYKFLVGRLPASEDLPPNVEISRRGIKEDLQRSTWALYRGTTAIVQAAAGGVVPIYVDSQNEMPIDPLYGVAQWRTKIDSPRALLDFIEKWEVEGYCDKRSEGIREYCLKFYEPMNPDVLKRYLATATAEAVDQEA